MLLRDRLRARIAEMGDAPDHQRLAAEVLGIRNASPHLARRLVAQALVVEDRRDANLRRRLRTHFAGRRWRGLKAELARATDAEWQEVGSELEALLREAELIHELGPIVNVQTGPPHLDARQIPRALVRDVIVVLRSVEPDSAQLVAARKDGGWLIQRTRRSGADLAGHTARLQRFFVSPLRRSFSSAPLAPIVFSWLARQGVSATRLDPHDAASPRELRARLAALLADEALFAERIVQQPLRGMPTSS